MTPTKLGRMKGDKSQSNISRFVLQALKDPRLELIIPYMSVSLYLCGVGTGGRMSCARAHPSFQAKAYYKRGWGE